jgi:hypothetical protein
MSDTLPIKAYALWVHEPGQWSKDSENGSLKMRGQSTLLRTSDPFPVPHVGDELTLQLGVDATGSKGTENRTLVVASVCHRVEASTDCLVWNVDVFTRFASDEVP